jgi:hypothetical protein
VFYAPFEYVNQAARLVLVGITPGPTQMYNANMAARAALLAGLPKQEVLARAKQTGAFSGEPMRTNLIKQLEHWGVNQWLGLSSASELFDSRRELLHTTSLLRFPVFAAGEDYRGTPDMTRTPMLRRYLLEGFASEAVSLKDAIFLGLGPIVQKVLDGLVREGAVPAERVVGGMLHPSGNCTYRIKYLVGDRNGAVPHATNPAPYDAGRARFRIISAARH